LAVRVTLVPDGKKASHAIAGQSIPAGVLVTLPLPAWLVPTPTLSPGRVSNLAIACRSAVMVTVQVPVPEQEPPHPTKVEGGTPAESGVAVSVTAVPAAKLAEHAEFGQSRPAGLLMTDPFPVPGRTPVITKGPAEEPPTRLTGCGLQAALSASFKVAVFIPLAPGAKVRATKHDPLRGLLHELLAMANSEALLPERVRPEKLKAPPLRVTVSVALVCPAGTAPKFSFVGVRIKSVTQPLRFTI